MSLRLRRLPIGFPGPASPPQDWDGSWRIYTICPLGTAASCKTRADILALSVADKTDARTSLVSFSQKAQTGQMLTAMYDEKQCHEAHSFKLHLHDTNEMKVMRIWAAGKIRMYFIYLRNKRIVLLKTSPKRKDKLNEGEKLELETLARDVLLAAKTNDFSTLELT